ncbi:hypothetical protein [Microbacterium rhizomatis]|uniref:Uncharacterized protein n=1 Tax=Microbacterium rhizomatis TaxID=1631477 RepID=A0A5J5J5V3_9MICO|nr:hypothetical protein [Microbacterium rhizomatis]KAA9111401.1 hypothetical protein F6B43_07450 [Microbacterium rhizomatis]
MSARNTTVRTLHDLGLAAWFGGTLMGAVGLNGGTAKASDPAERLKLSSIGWAKWSPVQVGALILHGIGGVGLIVGNRARLAAQPGARTNTAVKLAVTAVAVGATAYAGILGAKIAQHADEGGEGVTEADRTASDALASAQRQQRVVQWVIPALTGVLIILAAQQGEQQRPIAGLLRTLTHR